MLVVPVRRKMVMAGLRRLAITWGPLWVRVWDWSLHVADPVQAVLDRPVSADDRGQFGGARPGPG